MKQRLVHPKSILKGIVLTLVVLLFLQATQTSALAVQPQVAAGSNHTVGLKSDGPVVAVGDNPEGQLNVGSWTEIVQVAAGGDHTVGVKSDGTVVAVGFNLYGQLNVSSWTDIVQAAAGEHTVGVKTDGMVVAVGPSSANAPEQSDAHGIRSQIQNLIDVLDSQGYAELVSWDEHVVLVYRLAADREPSPAEFFQLKKLHDRTGLARSDVLSIALRGQDMRLSWEQCRTFLKRVTGADFRVDRSIRDKARQLAAIPEREVIKQVLPPVESSPAGDTGFQLQETDSIEPFEQYNIYFGYLHAHSTISPDGEGSPRRAYEHARDPGGLDFFALTDHGYAFNLWPWEDEWEEMVEAADDSYQPGIYVTLWGFEWTNLVYGHINVINSSEFTDFVSESTLHDIYNWITDRPTCFGRFNHPGDYDETGDEFSHFKPYSYAVEQMVGIENWNGNDGFDRHYYGGSWSSSETSYWDVGNQKGWYLGSLGGQDNHQEDWGIRNDFRTAVLAKELTREDIIDAYMHRRFYSTEDKDLHLDFRSAGYPMGSRLAGVSHIFEIKAWDESGDTFREVRLYRNGEMIRTQNVSGEAIHLVLDESSNNANSAYYYVIIQQNDDNDGNGRNDEAISSPIWISANPVFIDVLAYTPVTPCRIVDTRKAGGAISPGGIRSYNVRGAVASQGGNSTGCLSPKGEPLAVHVNVTSVPLGNGWITAYPFGSKAPTASLVNYRADAQNVANSGTVKTCAKCTKDISIKSGGGTTHVIIDVLGYYYAAP